jgi:hypothetical protein
MSQIVNSGDKDGAHYRDLKIAEKARSRGQATFTLVEQDITSPKTICFWILENIETAPEDKLVDALQGALLMRKAQNRKHAD